MPDLSLRLPTNVPGAFYVDETCIDCDLCRNNAPAFFARDPESGLSYVFRQPGTPAEIAEARDAQDGCPSGSIGNDGTSDPAAEA